MASRDVNFGAANIDVGVSENDAAYILTTVPDTGTGAHTIFRQIVAEVLTVSADDVAVTMGTTEMFPDRCQSDRQFGHLLERTSRPTGSLRTARQAHSASRRPCSAVRRTRSVWSEVPPSDPSAQESTSPILPRGRNRMDGSLSARGSIDIKERLGAICFFAEAAEVTVDPETGQVKVRKVISAHDVGTIINPLTHRGQVEGGMIQGFGFAMSEDLAIEDGKVVTANLGEYKLPNIRDIPEHETLYVRDHTGPGPFQAKQIGEHGAIPTAAAIANAVYDAIGVQITDLPITAEKVFAALRQPPLHSEANAPSAKSLARFDNHGPDQDPQLSLIETALSMAQPPHPNRQISNPSRRAGESIRRHALRRGYPTARHDLG